MSKILHASCANNTVTAEGVTISPVTVLSNGVGESEGVLLLDEDKATYVTSNATDLGTSIEKLVDLIGKLTTYITNIDIQFTAMSGVGGVAANPTAASELSTLSTDLTTLGNNLK
jgi:hypothetical protein